MKDGFYIVAKRTDPLRRALDEVRSKVPGFSASAYGYAKIAEGLRRDWGFKIDPVKADGRGKKAKAGR